MVIYAGVEGGGTTWRVALAEGHPSNIVESKSFVTLDDAQEQLKEIKEWLSTRKYDCLGIGTFGPIDPREVRLLGVRLNLLPVLVPVACESRVNTESFPLVL